MGDKEQSQWGQSTGPQKSHLMEPQLEGEESTVWPQAPRGSESSQSRMENLSVKTSMTGGSTGGSGKQEAPPS